GEGVATATATACLGLANPSGAVVPAARSQTAVPAAAFGIVGQITLDAALSELDNFTLIFPRTADPPAVSVTALARSTQDVAGIAKAMLELSGAAQKTSLAVTTSAALADLNTILQAELSSSSRAIGLAAMAAGMAFAGLALMLSVGGQRRDFGRRRALGASRSLLITLVMLEGVTPAAIGAIAGTALGMTGVILTTETLPDAAFTASIPILTTIAVMVGALPAALTAAYRDPVNILRVP
ncbi:MAG: hypothetical protein LBU38_01235, partial [Propionibacteriaceae bacterium]|nr:hypothetical protein [Propionibacteriaceae bacterium]